MNISICDSDKKICENISNLIRAENLDSKIFIFNSKEEFLRSKENFSICFLDIKGVDGLEIAKILRRREKILQTSPSVLIFVTGYDDFMAEAFDVHAFHYLLKPIDAKKFSQVLNRAVDEIKNFQTQSEKFLLIKVEGMNKKIFLRDIFFVESANKKVIIHTAEENFEIQGKMETFEIALGENFFRCHRFFIVNLAKISAYNSNTIFLDSGDKIFISQKKYAEFVKIFLNYAQSGGAVNVR